MKALNRVFAVVGIAAAISACSEQGKSEAKAPLVDATTVNQQVAATPSVTLTASPSATSVATAEPVVTTKPVATDVPVTPTVMPTTQATPTTVVSAEPTATTEPTVTVTPTTAPEPTPVVGGSDQHKIEIYRINKSEPSFPANDLVDVIRTRDHSDAYTECRYEGLADPVCSNTSQAGYQNGRGYIDMKSGEPVAIDYNLRRTAMVSTEQGYDVLDSYVRNDKTQTTEQYNKNYVEGQLQSVAGAPVFSEQLCAVATCGGMNVADNAKVFGPGAEMLYSTAEYVIPANTPIYKERTFACGVFGDCETTRAVDYPNEVVGVQCIGGSACAVNLQTGAIQDEQGNELATAAISNYNQNGVWGYQIDANEYTAAKYLIVGDVYWSWSTWSYRAEWYLVYSQDIVIDSNTVFVNEVAFNDMRSALQDMPAK